MAEAVPGVANPDHADKHGLFTDPVCVKFVRHLLHLVVGSNNFIFCAVLHHDDLLEAPNIFEKVMGILSILFCVFPNETLCIRVDEYEADLLHGNIVVVEDLGFLDGVRCDIGEAGISVHLLKHLWELNGEGLVVKSSDESLQERFDHVNTSRHFHVVSGSRDHQDIFTHNVDANVVYTPFGRCLDLIKGRLHGILSLECWRASCIGARSVRVLSVGLARASKYRDLVEAVELVAKLTDTPFSWQHGVILGLRVILIEQEELLAILGGALPHKAVNQESVFLRLGGPALVNNSHDLPVGILGFLLRRIHQLERIVVLHSEIDKVSGDLVTDFLRVGNVLVSLVATVHAGVVGLASDKYQQDLVRDEVEVFEMLLQLERLNHSFEYL